MPGLSRQGAVIACVLMAGGVSLLALAVRAEPRATEAGFWFEAVNYASPRLGSAITPGDLEAIEDVARSELARAFEGLHVTVSDRRDARYRVRVVQDLRDLRSRRIIRVAGESRAVSGFGGQGAVSFTFLASGAIAYAPDDAGRASMLEAIGRGIGRAAVHEFTHQFLPTAPIHDGTDIGSYEYESAARREQYFGELHWGLARPLLERRLQVQRNTPAVERSIRDADERAVRDADDALTAAVDRGDATAIARALDYDDFSWITPAGVKLSRTAVVASPPRSAFVGVSDAKAEARRLGTHVVVVQRHSDKTHAMHVWVRRDVGWRLLHVNEVIEGDRVVYGGTMIGAANCINPCKVVPFEPANQVERAVIEAWQAQQSGPEQWAAHIPEDNIARTSNGTYTKADRVAVQRRQIEAGTVVAPSPLTWARIWEFGDSALMIALQPRAVGKPFWGSRVFERRDGTWMMAESYQTSIEDHPPY